MLDVFVLYVFFYTFLELSRDVIKKALVLYDTKHKRCSRLVDKSLNVSRGETVELSLLSRELLVADFYESTAATRLSHRVGT